MDAELWTAVAASVLGPTVAIILGVGSFWLREERQRASQRYLDDGAVRLLKVISARLSIYLLNVQTANYSIRLLKTYEPGGPLAPGSDSIPSFLDVDLDTLPVDLILPVQELIGDDSVMHWVVTALSDVTLYAKEMDFQIGQPLVAYFRGDVGTNVDRDEAIKRLSKMVDAWDARLRPHFALLDRLHDLITHVERNRPWRFSGYATVPRRPEVAQMREAWRDGYEQAKRAREAAAPALRGSQDETDSSVL